MIQDTKEFAKTMTEAGKTAWKTTSTYLQAAVEEEEQEQEVEREVETPPSSEDETFNFTENEKIAQEIAVVKEQLKQLENRQQALLTNQDKPPVTESPVQKENPTKELLAGWIKRGDMDAVCEAVTHKEKLEKIVPHIKDPTKKEEFDQRIQEVTQWLQEMQTKI